MFMDAIDKQALFNELQVRVDQELNQLLQAQRAIQEGATHEESRPENDKDTRALESTYLARGLAERVVKLEREVQELRKLRVRDFARDNPVALSALVRVEYDDGDALYLVSPAGGGLRLSWDTQVIFVVTLQAPIGMALLGKYCDEEIEIMTPQGRRIGTLVDIR